MRKSIKHLFGLTLGVSLALGLISSASAEGSVSVQVAARRYSPPHTLIKTTAPWSRRISRTLWD